MPTRHSRAGRLSGWPLRVCSQVELVAPPNGATAIRRRASVIFAWDRSRSSLVFGGGGGVGGGEAACAQVSGTTSPMIPRIPHSTALQRDRFIVTSAVLLSHMLRVRSQAEALILSLRPACHPVPRRT